MKNTTTKPVRIVGAPTQTQNLGLLKSVYNRRRLSIPTWSVSLLASPPNRRKRSVDCMRFIVRGRKHMKGEAYNK